MMQDQGCDRLSRITTHWTLVVQAHSGEARSAASARHELFGRYGGAAHRYLLGALRDPEAAAELSQEFALRFVRGDFHRADPDLGRFRNLVKSALFHLIVDHRNRLRRRPLPLVNDGPVGWDPKRDFDQDWRDELLARGWEALAADQASDGRPYYAVLRLKADHPELTSVQLAGRLGTELGRRLTAEGVRQTLHRARGRFAELLLREVARSLDRPDREQIEQELIELRLLGYCRPALARQETATRRGKEPRA